MRAAGYGSRGTEENPDSDRMLGTPAYMAPEQFECRWRDFGPWTVKPDLAKMAHKAAVFATAAGRIPEARQALLIAMNQWQGLRNEPRSREAEEMLSLLPD